MDNKKYELTNETINVDGHILHRIKALRSFSDVKAGDLGGFIESEYNLDHNDNCWVYDNAKVYGNTKVCGHAMVCDNAKVYGNAEVRDHALVADNAKVYVDAKVCGDALVSGNAKVCGDAVVFNDAKVYDNAIVHGNAEVYGDARVFGNTKLSSNAYISNTNDYITIGPIGSRDGYTTFYLNKDRNIYVSCGCFNGSINEFKDKVLETHKDNDLYREQYLSVISFAKNNF